MSKDNKKQTSKAGVSPKTKPDVGNTMFQPKPTPKKK